MRLITKVCLIASLSAALFITIGCAPENIEATGSGGSFGGGGSTPANLSVNADASPITVGGNTFVRATVLDAENAPVPMEGSS